jgi:hypothetical protein
MKFNTLFVIFILGTSLANAQVRNQLWLSGEISHEPIKKVELDFNTNIRFGTPDGLNTLYQELGAKYTKIKWFRPSIDYRFITSYDERRNYSYTHRLNFNADFRHKLSDFKIGIRFRYQMYLARGVALETGTDLDPSFRIKPYVDWDIPKKKFKPGISAEFFYDPSYGPFGRTFNRVRLGANIEFDLPKKQTLNITYYFGNKYFAKNRYVENILSLTYGFEWKRKTTKKVAD